MGPQYHDFIKALTFVPSDVFELTQSAITAKLERTTIFDIRKFYEGALRKQGVRIVYTFLRLRIVLQNSRLSFEEGDGVFEAPPNKRSLFAKRLVYRF